MEMNRELLEDLVLDELGNKISSSDKQLLDEMLAKYPDARAIRLEMLEAFSTEAGQRVLNDEMVFPVTWIFDRVRQKRRRRIVISVMSAAALLAGLVFFLYPNNQLPNAGMVVKAKAKIADKHIRLSLANGESIDLTTDTSAQVRVANITLPNSNKTLRFDQVQPTDQWATLEVPVGKDYKVNLPDGSEVWLNSATSIHFPLKFSGASREITVDGEAYVKVVPVAGKPFVVHLPQSTVNVLGTEFNVNTYDSGQTRVALVTGSVNVAAKGKTVLIKPGYQLVSTGTNDDVLEKFDNKVVLGWRQGIYIYQNASLQELGRILSRWFGVDVVLDNKSVSTMRFNGVIRRDDDIDEYLRNLEYTNGPSFYIKDKVVHFK